MDRAHQPRSDQLADEQPGIALERQVDGRRKTFLAAMDLAQPQRLAELPALRIGNGPNFGADQVDGFAPCLERHGGHFVIIVDQADAANGGGGQDGGSAARGLAFIVEADVPAHDREIEYAASLTHAFEAADELRHDFRPLRVAEIETIGHRERARANRGQVAVSFRNGLLAAFVRIGIAIARRAVGGDGKRLAGSVDADHAGIAAGLQRVCPDLAVILFRNPAARGEVGRADQLEQVCADIRTLGLAFQRLHLRPGAIFLARDMRPVIFRRISGQRAERDVADHLPVELEDHVLRVGDFADHREIELPLAEDRFGHGFLARLEHHEHPLLAFREHHFVGRHALFAARHLVHVEPDAGLAVGRHLDAGGGETRRAHVLYRHDGVRRHQFEAGLDQQLFRERIADLHGWALGIGVFFEIGAGHGGAVDPVAPGLGADIDDRIADAGGGRIENPVRIGDAHSHRIDEDVAVIGCVEVGLARHGRHAHAIAVAADPGDHAFDEMLHLGVVGPAEAQRIGIRHRPRAHGEHVAQYAAHAGRRALVGLDIGGVVVALHLEDRRLPVTDVDDARILSGAADHPGRLGRQLLEMEARALVRAMLAPHHRKDAQFDQIGLAAHRVENTLVFLGAEPMLGNDFGCDL